MKKVLNLTIMLLVVLGLAAIPVFSSIPTHGGNTTTNNREEVIVHYDGDNDDSIGTGDAITFQAAIRLTALELTQYDGATLERVQMYVAAGASTVDIKVYEGSTAAAPGQLLLTQAVPNLVLDSWNDVTLTNPITIDSSMEYWIGYEVVATTGYPAGCDAGPVVTDKGAKMYVDGTWQNLIELAPALNGNWNIRAVVQTNTTPIENDIAILSVLAPNGFVDYTQPIVPVIQITNNGTNDGVTEISVVIDDEDSNEVYFQNVTSITVASGATIDYSMPAFTAVAEMNYTLTAFVEPTVDDNTNNNQATALFNTVVVVPADDWTDGFEDYTDFSIDFDPWTNVDVDGLGTYGFTGTDWLNAYDPQAFIIFNPSATTPAVSDADAYEGNKYAACFASVPAAGVYNNDWMMTPILNLGNNPEVSFMARSYTTDYGMERFTVAVSTGSTDPADFTVVSAGTYVEVSDTWTEYNLSLSAFAGQEVRVAIHCVSHDAFIFMVDNFAVTGLGSTDASEGTQPELNTTTLNSNYPNPFNPETTISFNLKNSENVTLEIFNTRGQKVNTLIDSHLNAGSHNILWKGTDASNGKVASGIYFYKLQAGTYTATKKMILMK